MDSKVSDAANGGLEAQQKALRAKTVRCSGYEGLLGLLGLLGV